MSSVPYDVVSTEEARQMAAGNPLSFLRVTRSEIDLPAGTDPYAPQVYERARHNLDALHHSVELKRYYDQTLRQGAYIFWVGVSCLFAGFAIIGIAVAWSVRRARPTNGRELLAMCAVTSLVLGLGLTTTACYIFLAILVGGLCGGLIGYGFTDLQCTGDCTNPSALGGVFGAIIGACGVAVVAVLGLRAMGEWRRLQEQER